MARRQSKLEELADQLGNQYETETKIITADLASSEGVQLVLDQSKGIDIGLFVASAGFGTSGAFLKSNLEEELDMLQVNCNTVLKMTHHFAQQFASRQKGGIILMGSLVGFQGAPYAAHYSATKAWNQTLAEALSVELKPMGIDVLSAAPGPVNSGFGKRADMQMGNAQKPENIAPSILKALGKKQTVLPGSLTKFLVYSLRTLPRWGKVRVMKLVMSGMTRHQRI